MVVNLKTIPLAHQAAAIERFGNASAWALWWDPGVGKSLPTVHVAARRYAAGDIDRVLVVAPNVVHANWITDELPKHGITDLRSLAWHSDKAQTKYQREASAEILQSGSLAVLAVSYDGIKTDAGRELCRQFLGKKQRAMVVADELHWVKTPSSERSKVTIAAGKLAGVRVGLTGTPIAQSPLDAYAQIRFLDGDYWKRRGIGSYTAFKHHFATWKQVYWNGKKCEELDQYQNLDELRDILHEVGSRLSRDEALDLPPQVFAKLEFELAPAQRRVYESLVDTYQAEVRDGLVIEAPLALQRLMRLHQVACGFYRDENDETHQICAAMPRLDALEARTADLTEQALVWTRFRHDAQGVAERLNGWKPSEYRGPLGPRCGRIDGTVSERERQEVLSAFRTGKIQFLVANPLSLGIGVTLNEAKFTINYSYDWALVVRLQSDARNYRVGQDSRVVVTDLVARDTVDERVRQALVENHDVAAMVQGDKWREWIR